MTEKRAIREGSPNARGALVGLSLSILASCRERAGVIELEHMAVTL